ncbi:MAG: protein sorting system archaetidylserine decarboxylase [Haloarculaceae archaeon]
MRPRVAPGAWRYAVGALGLGLLLTVVSGPLGVALALAAPLAVLAFHRDPERTPPTEGVVAPADGTVSVLREEGDRVRVGIYMSPTDVHVNRAPAPGRVEAVEHEPGGHRPAFSKESEHNERLHVRCGEYTLTLVAGAFARRIHPYVEVGDRLDRGERVGHISFGSRADVLLPADVSLADVAVEQGESVTAGETRLV